VPDAAWPRSLREPPSEALTISHHFACPVSLEQAAIYGPPLPDHLHRLSGQKSLFKGR
jgi:hypothetical protein